MGSREVRCCCDRGDGGVVGDTESEVLMFHRHKWSDWIDMSTGSMRFCHTCETIHMQIDYQGFRNEGYLKRVSEHRGYEHIGD